MTLVAALLGGIEVTPIIDRIKKLLALSESDNVNEAAAAAAAAQKLMSAHGIEQAAIDAASGAVDEAVDSDILFEHGARASTWKGIVAAALAHANGCAVYNFGRYGDGQRQVATMIVGPKGAASTVRYMHAYLVAEVDRLARAQDPGNSGANLGRAWYASFRLGAAMTISQKIRGSHAEVMGAAAASGESKDAIVLIEKRKDAVARIMAEKRLSKARKATTSSSSGYAAGVVAGRGVSVGNSSRAALGAGSNGSLKG
jgi:hypothetical protein